MSNINLLSTDLHDSSIDHASTKSTILSILFTSITREQSNALIELVITGTSCSSCICCAQEDAKYIIKKVGHGEIKIHADIAVIEKLVIHTSKKIQFDCPEFQLFIERLTNS